jgi:hypothetical protein
MITEYPYFVERKFSRSSKINIQLKNKEFNDYCSKVEKWINEQIKNGRRGTIHYSEITNELSLPDDFLGKKLIIDCGHNGFTIDPNLQID